MTNIEYYGIDWVAPPDWFSTDRDIDLVQEIYGWTPKENVFSVFLDSHEPDFVLSTNASDVLERHKDFDLIVTRRPELLHLPNAIRFPYGTTWIREEVRETLSNNKLPKVSYTMTSKFWQSPSGETLDGYQLRFQIMDMWSNIESISALPIDFYESEKFPIGRFPLRLEGEHGKDVLMEYMFHIAVENCRIPNYFSEKLMDCFMSKTLPIYFGCPNISEYFDTSGMIIIDNLSNLNVVLSNLTVDDYETRKEAIDRNFELAKQYEKFPDRLFKEIKKRV